MIDVAVIGGGAAGFFAAINIKIKHPGLKVVIFEKSKTVLGKVKISGGGRCNVTHACFSVTDLLQYYPRGNRELQSVFNRFNPEHTIAWFADKGVNLKTEADGRMFPVSDSSETIVNCLLHECEKHRIAIRTGLPVNAIAPDEQGFVISCDQETIKAKKVVITTGSSDYFWQLLKKLGHTLIAPVPSLFTFNIQHPFIQSLQGVSIPNVGVKLMIEPAIIKKLGLNIRQLEQYGPLLFTHWGFSGPSILKLSAVGARLLNHQNYRFDISLNFCTMYNEEQVLQILLEEKKNNPKKQVSNTPLFGLPGRFWQNLVQINLTNEQIIWADISRKECQLIAASLAGFKFSVNGKSTFKEEFVTSGGIALKEIDFKTMESKIIPGMYFAGEVLDIDALTGGFNFQAAWSEAWIVAESINLS